MSAWGTKSGFTLIEVLAAVGAFTIAFLAGFAAIGTFMIKQDMNYQHTVAASTAMLLAEYHINQNNKAAGLGSDLPTNLTPLLDAVPAGNKPYITPKGGGISTWTGQNLYVFKTAVVNDGLPTATSLDLTTNSPTGYDFTNLTISIPATATTATGGTSDIDHKIPWRKISLWYGSPSDVVAAVDASHKTTIEFLGSYVIPDTLNP